jgi:hypothetical protein
MVHVIESLRRHFGHASFRAGQEELAFTANFGSISSAQDSRQLHAGRAQSFQWYHSQFLGRKCRFT